MLALCLLLLLAAAPPPATTPAPWRAVALGSAGGLIDGDLTSFLIQRPGKSYVVLDAGTLIGGLVAAHRKGAFPDVDAQNKGISHEAAAGVVLREQTSAVLLSHPHLDHLAGLVIATPDDKKRQLLALPATIDALRDHVFNGVVWANFGNEGKGSLAKLEYVRMEANKPVHLAEAGVDVTAFPLSHAGATSTAFLLDDGTSAVLFCGDTGADGVEGVDKLARLMTAVAPLVRGHRLAALFIETSFPSARPDGQLFGHLTPRHLMSALHGLARAVDSARPGEALKGLTVVAIHVKPTLEKGVRASRDVIREELAAQNDLGVRFLMPEQGDVLTLSPP